MLGKLKLPVLALHGSRDVQVWSSRNAASMAEALAAGGNPDFTVSVLAGMNQLFQKPALAP